jgi:hypothetical protein
MRRPHSRQADGVVTSSQPTQHFLDLAAELHSSLEEPEHR